MNHNGKLKAFPFFDGLRGLAALIVVFHHYAFGFFQSAVDGNMVRSHLIGESTIFTSPWYLLIAGNFAVCIFFVLSGIVLTAKFFQHHDTAILTTSAAKRYWRLGIPVFVIVMIAYSLLAIGFLKPHEAAAINANSPWLSNLWQGDHSFLAAIYHGAAGVFISGHSSYVPVLWTMHYELYGSFLIFMVAGLFGRLRNRWICYALVSVMLLQTYYLAFLIGVMLCDAYYQVDWTRLTRRLEHHAPVLGRLTVQWGWLPLLISGCWLGAVPSDGSLAGTAYYHLSGNVNPELFRLLAHTFGAAVLIVAILSSAFMQTVLSTRLFSWLGKNSYAMYLTHILIIGSFSSYLFTSLRISHGYRTSFAIMFMVSLLVILLCSTYFTRFVDQPAIRIAGIINRRIFSPHENKVARSSHGSELQAEDVELKTNNVTTLVSDIEPALSR